MRRGEAAGILRVSISADDEQCTDKLKRHYVHGYGECQTLVGEAVDDAFKRLLKPSIETEFAASSKLKADEEAIRRKPAPVALGSSARTEESDGGGSWFRQWL